MKKISFLFLFTLTCYWSFAVEYNNGTIKSVTNATKSTEKYNGCDVYVWNGSATSIKVSATISKQSGYHDAITTSFWECILNGSTNYECPHYTTNINATIPVSKLTNNYNSIRFRLEDAIAGSLGSYNYYVTNTIYIRKAQLVTITWKNADGSTIKTSQVAIGATPSYTGTTPTKAATAQYTYTFKGWTPTIVAATANATYTATYTQTLRQYTITWKNSDGTTLKTEQVAYGATPSYTGTTPTKPATAEYTYTFAGWTPEVEAVTGDATYTATYTATKNSYTITWKQDDGTTIDETTVEYGEVPTHEDPTKDATAEYTYTFAGWTPEVEAVTGDATYTATYTATKNSYTITWLQDDGTTIDETTVEYGEVPTHEDPTKDATAEYTYTFAGWSPEVVAVTSEATYTATYTATKNSYTITWKQDDGTTIDETTVEYGEVPTHADPTKPTTAEYTYTFAGWSPEVVAVTGEATYTATYTATKNSYTITWKQDDGTTIDQTTVEYGEVPTHADPTKPATAEYTYTFAGWTPEVVAVAGEATYTATYSATKNSYTITWKQDDGTTIDETTVEYGEVPTHADPTKPATAEYTYTFAGWTPEVEAVTGEATYTATYTATKNSYTITWKQDDGTTIDETTVEYGEVPTHADPTKPTTAEYTYTFAGWSPEVVAVTGEATYTATYTATKNSYTITWKQDDGTTIDETIVEYGQVPTHEDPTKPATAEYTYTFAGWTPEVVSVTGEATYTATYMATKIIYDIDVTPEDDAEGTVGIEGDPTYGSTITLTATPNDCYHFVRWSDGNTDNPRSVVVNGNLSLKAIFEQDSYTVTWQNTDGRTLETDDILCGETPTYDGTTPTQADSYNYQYTFSGWEPAIVPATEDATYTAVYDSTALIPNADNCIECQNAPVVALYDYLLMLNVKELKAAGYTFTDQDVKWYRIAGKIDNLDTSAPQHDDELMATGMYLTLAQNLSGTGRYYAVVDMSKTTNKSLCMGLMRSAVINYNAAPARHSVALLPNIIRGAGMMTLSGLLPEEATTINVYDPAGRLVHTFTTTGTNEYALPAVPQPGCYHVRVESETLQTTLKYVVYNE